MLDALTLEGFAVSVDAIGCQTRIASQTIDGDAGLGLALEANQETLHELAAHHFAVTEGRSTIAPSTRIMNRRCSDCSTLTGRHRRGDWQTLRL